MDGVTYNYIVPDDKTPQGLAEFIKDFLSLVKHMETQVCVPNESGNVCFIQARTRNGNIKWLFGLDKAVTVKITVLENRHITLEIGGAKWIDKGVATAMGFLFFAPLVISTFAGVVGQDMLLNQIRKEAEAYLFGGASATYNARCRTIRLQYMEHKKTQEYEQNHSNLEGETRNE